MFLPGISKRHNPSTEDNIMTFYLVTPGSYPVGNEHFCLHGQCYLNLTNCHNKREKHNNLLLMNFSHIVKYYEKLFSAPIIFLPGFMFL